MILEYLERTLSDQYLLISHIIFNNIEKFKQYKRLIYEMLICVDGNSREGIIHCDSKGDNLMIYSKGRVRNIDYGYSYYLGISPLKDNINHRIHGGNYLMQDGRPERIEKDGTITQRKIIFKNNIGIEIFSIDSGYLSYNLDVASIGLFFIQMIVGYTYRYLFHNGKIYRFSNKDEDIRCISYIIYEDTTIIQKLKDKYGDELTNLIFTMIEINWLIRPTAKELIFGHIFDNIPCNYPKDLQLTDLFEDNTIITEKKLLAF